MQDARRQSAWLLPESLRFGIFFRKRRRVQSSQQLPTGPHQRQIKIVAHNLTERLRIILSYVAPAAGFLAVYSSRRLHPEEPFYDGTQIFHGPDPMEIAVSKDRGKFP